MSPLPDHIESAQSYGYKRSSDNRCPRTLVGKRCMDMKCWCYTRANDHGATYEHFRETLILWEPYEVYGDVLVGIVAAADADGIDLHVHGKSPYFPGRTVVMEFSARDKEVAR